MSYTPPPPPPQGPGDPGGVPPGYGAPAYGAPQSSTKAVLSLVIGIVSLPLGFCCAFFGLVGIAAIVLSRSAQGEIAASGGALTGDGMARAGFILGIIGCVLGVILTIVNIALVASGGGVFDFNNYSG
jgi:hypothetical protein